MPNLVEIMAETARKQDIQKQTKLSEEVHPLIRMRFLPKGMDINDPEAEEYRKLYTTYLRPPKASDILKGLHPRKLASSFGRSAWDITSGTASLVWNWGTVGHQVLKELFVGASNELQEALKKRNDAFIKSDLEAFVKAQRQVAPLMQKEFPLYSTFVGDYIKKFFSGGEAFGKEFDDHPVSIIAEFAPYLSKAAKVKGLPRVANTIEHMMPGSSIQKGVKKGLEKTTDTDANPFQHLIEAGGTLGPGIKTLKENNRTDQEKLKTTYGHRQPDYLSTDQIDQSASQFYEEWYTGEHGYIQTLQQTLGDLTQYEMRLPPPDELKGDLLDFIPRTREKIETLKNAHQANDTQVSDIQNAQQFLEKTLDELIGAPEEVAARLAAGEPILTLDTLAKLRTAYRNNNHEFPIDTPNVSVDSKQLIDQIFDALTEDYIDQVEQIAAYANNAPPHLMKSVRTAKNQWRKVLALDQTTAAKLMQFSKGKLTEQLLDQSLDNRQLYNIRQMYGKKRWKDVRITALEKILDNTTEEQNWTADGLTKTLHKIGDKRLGIFVNSDGVKKLHELAQIPLRSKSIERAIKNAPTGIMDNVVAQQHMTEYIRDMILTIQSITAKIKPEMTDPWYPIEIAARTIGPKAFAAFIHTDYGRHLILKKTPDGEYIQGAKNWMERHPDAVHAAQRARQAKSQPDNQKPKTDN